ncbi:hypothetical protein [Azonexus sp.]|uniref:hypothetical protein n=1 Tax=Azonexus sp. TaxID=1872668 RepID=UPI0035B34910
MKLERAERGLFFLLDLREAFFVVVFFWAFFFAARASPVKSENSADAARKSLRFKANLGKKSSLK